MRMHSHSLNSQQISFIDLVISFLCVKGTIGPAMLFESPFTYLISAWISGLFDNDAATMLITLLVEINENVETA